MQSFKPTTKMQRDHSKDWTPIEELPIIHASLRKTFSTHLTLPLTFRRAQLLQLARMAQENAESFAAAIALDIGRPKQETYMAEIGPIVQRALICARKVAEWAKDDDVSGLVQDWQKSWRCRVRKEPKGVALIISPWNYPMMLSLQPLYGAISAGCCALIKLSEYAPNYGVLLTELFPKYLDQRAYRVVRGGVPEVTKLLEMKFDHIFYTGNPRIARIIAAAAAKHLTPVTLELGGKSPVLIDHTADLNLAAKRILWGKLNNSGQICVTPDYALLPRSLLANFVEALKTHLATFFPQGSLVSESFSRIISEEHFARLKNLLHTTKGEILIGGGDDEAVDVANRRGGKGEGKKGIEISVVKVDKGDVLLETEIFGPILPIILVEDLDEAIEYVNSRPNPLVLYAFTEDEDTKHKILDCTSSGNIVFNDTFGQMAVNELPFGGVGESGYGRQVLKYSFDLFSYERAVTDVPMKDEHFNGARYPPYTKESLEFMKAPTLVHIPTLEELEKEEGVKEKHGVLGWLHKKIHPHSDHHAEKSARSHDHDGLSNNPVQSGAMGGSGVGLGGGNFQL